jgi:hypothetical protein
VEHFLDLGGKPLCAEYLCLEEPAHLGGGQRGDVAESCRGQRALALGLDHAAVTDEDHLGDPKARLERMDLLGHSDRIGRVALVHMHSQRLTLRRGQQPNDDLRLAGFLVSVIPKGCQFILCPLQVRGGHVIQDHRGRAALLLYAPTIERVLNGFLLCG